MHRTLRAFGAAAATAVVACGLLWAGPAADAGTDTSMTGAPAVGNCFDLTLKQVGGRSIAKDPVACTEDHTAVVIDVSTLPSRLDWSSSIDDIGAVVLKRCNAALGDRIGTNLLQRSRSQYAWFWFEPTQAQRDAGARWFDCVLTTPEDTRLPDLSRKLPHLSRKLPNSVARCVTGTNKYTTCADTHAWRSSYGFYATGTATEQHVVRAAKRVCPNHVSSRTWRYSSWDIPGKRFIVDCYSKTRH